MTFRGHASAKANDLPWPGFDGTVDMNPALTQRESTALRALSGAFAKKKGWGSKGARSDVKRVLAPVETLLLWIRTPFATRHTVKHLLIIEMSRLDRPYWAWTAEECLEILCPTVADYKARHGDHGNCRQHILASMCLLCGFDRLTEIGGFHRYHLAIKVFGRLAVDEATNAIYAEISRVGHRGHSRYGVAQALHMALLMERSAQIENISLKTLEKIAAAGPRLLRMGASLLSRTLVRLGVLQTALDLTTEARRLRQAAPDSYRAIDDVPASWAVWISRWRNAAVGAPSTLEKHYFSMLKFARWLGAAHPDVKEPAELTREIALEYVAAVDRMKVGEWSTPTGNSARTLGKPLTPRSKAAQLKVLRRFLGDLQEWEWISRRFDPARIFSVPKAILTLIGPSPRMIAEDVWAKIVWAGMNIEEIDVMPCTEDRGRAGGPRYPVELVRAVAHLWLFAGLRSDEIFRLPRGCVRWQRENSVPDEPPVCLLDVPVGKTSTAFSKPVDAIVGEAIEKWERVRFPHPRMLDAKTGHLVDFLFVHRGQRVSKDYINITLIPLLCSKAGVPRDDVRGRITSHRARATIATQLYNAKEPLSLFELKDWLGHADLRATQHYAAMTPTKLIGAFRRAGYFERNLRTVAVLIDQDVIRKGAATRGEPWRYYDLGHGFCAYDFFDQCPHRMVCAKCSFYLPKESARAQALEANVNLSRMLQEIPLRDDERAAVEDGVDAMTKLAEKLFIIAAPDGRTPSQIASSPERSDETARARPEESGS